MYLTNLHKYKRFKLDIKHLDVTPDDSLKNTIVNKLGVADDTKCIPDTINKIIELAGSGSGTTYEGTHGIDVNNSSHTISAKTDNKTIKVNSDGNLEAIGSSGTISEIKSSDNSINVTNPTGPTVDITVNGGVGKTYSGDHGIDVNNETNTITAKTDDVTIKVNEDGNLEAVGSGGSYTAGRAIEIDEENHINALTDDVTIGVTEDNKLKAEKYEINIKSESESSISEVTGTFPISVDDPTTAPNVKVATATTNSLGVVRPDNDTITISDSGIISAKSEGKTYTGDHGVAVDNSNNTITAKTDDVTIKVNEDGNLEAVNSGGGISKVVGIYPIRVDDETTTPRVSLQFGAGLEDDRNILKVLPGAGLNVGRDGVGVNVDNTTIEIDSSNKLHVISGGGGGGSDTFVKAGDNVTFDGGTHVGNNYYKGYVTINASGGGTGGSDTFIKAGNNVTFDGGTHVGNNYYKGYVTINASGGTGGSYTAGDGIYITDKNVIRVYKVPYNISWNRQLISCSTSRHNHYHGHQSMNVSSSLGYYNGYLYATTDATTGTEGSIYGGGLCSIGSNVGVYASSAIADQTIYGYLYYGALGSTNDLDPIEQEYYSQHPEEFRNQLSDSDKKWFNIHNLDIYSFEMENFTIKKGKIKDISELGWVWYRNTLIADSTGGMIVEKVDIHNLLVEGWNPNELGVHKVVVTNPIVPGDPTTFYMKVVE